MNDASEVLAVIFDCLHQSLTPSSSVSDTESVESNYMGSWDCASDTCLVHSIFGMDIFERMNCYSCGLESRHLKYTSFFHNINASALRTMKVTHPHYSVVEDHSFTDGILLMNTVYLIQFSSLFRLCVLKVPSMNF